MQKYYLGVDYHKAYSVCTIIDNTGKEIVQGKISNTKEAVARFVEPYEPVAAVMEVGRNWEVMYEWLEETTTRVQLAHPYKVKAIASAKIKTDKIDSSILSQLLRADLVPTAYVPGMETRQAKAVLRQRLFYVRQQTAIKNRITTQVDKYILKNEITPPMKTFYSGIGIKWIERIPLPETERAVLSTDLAALKVVQEQIQSSNELIERLSEGDEDIRLLRTIPGLGPFLSVLVRHEIGDIKRFPEAKKLLSYAGIIPSTYQSGRHIRHGRLTKEGNKWLRYAMIEAVWGAMINDEEIRCYYQRLKKRKGSNPAKVATARRLLTI